MTAINAWVQTKLSGKKVRKRCEYNAKKMASVLIMIASQVYLMGLEQLSTQVSTVICESLVEKIICSVVLQWVH